MPKTWFITGASRGFGREWTIAALDRGDSVAAGDHHNAALRNLANKALGRMWWCLQNGEPWNENSAWNCTTEHSETLAA